MYSIITNIIDVTPERNHQRMELVKSLLLDPFSLRFDCTSAYIVRLPSDFILNIVYYRRVFGDQ